MDTSEVYSRDEFQQFESDILSYLESGFAPDEGPLAFVNLERLGRKDLMSGIIKYGGYARIAEKLNLDTSLFIPPLQAAKSKSFPDFYKSEDGAKLSLGRDLDARLDTIDSVNSGEDHSSQQAFSGGMNRNRDIDDVPSAEQLRQQKEQFTPRIVDEIVPPGETLSLSGEMRLGILFISVIAALGFGHSSVGLLDLRVLATCQALAFGLMVAHAGLAVYSAVSLAPNLGRDPTIWFAKVLLSGPLGVRTLRMFGPIATRK